MNGGGMNGVGGRR
jgi:hypothetical protein